MVPTTFEQLLQEATTAANHSQYEAAVTLYTDLLAQISPQVDDPDVREVRLTALRERGRLLSLLGEQLAALAAYQQYYREAGESTHAVEALVRIGNQSRGLGRYEEAQAAYQKATELAQTLAYPLGQAKAVAGIGGMFLLLGRIEEAINYLNQANTLFEELGDISGRLQSLNQIGISYGNSGRLDEAIAMFEASLKLARDLGRHDRQVVTLNNLGECYQMLFDLDRAIAYHEEGLALAERAHLRLIEADLCRNLGLDYTYLGRVDEGLLYLNRALKLSQETNNMDMEQHTLYALALAEIARNNLSMAVQYGNQLKETAESNDARGHLANALYVLGLVRQRQGDSLTAEELWQQALFLAHETDKRMLLWQIHARLGEIAMTPYLARVHNRIASEIIQQIAEPIQKPELRQIFLNAPPVRAVLGGETGNWVLT